MRYLFAVVLAVLVAALLSWAPVGTIATSSSDPQDPSSSGTALGVGPGARRIAVSHDGVHFRSDLRRPLFGRDIRWVPGDARRRSFYLRHRHGRPTGISVALRRHHAGQLVRSRRVVIRLRARVVSPREHVTLRWRTMVPGRPVPLARQLHRGHLVRIDVEAHFRGPVRHSMRRHGHIRFRFATANPTAAPRGDHS